MQLVPCRAELRADTAQGIVGTMPWIALGWLTLYLQLLGFSDLAAAMLNALSMLGCALGSFCGGLLGAPLSQTLMCP